MDELSHTTAPRRLASMIRFRWLDIKEAITGYLYILPAFIIIGLFGIFPIGFAAYVSLFQWRINPGDYIGLSNYVKALENITYVLGFWLVAILTYLAIRNIQKIIHVSTESDEKPWLWIIPGIITTLGLLAFLRFIVLLLPEILAISSKVRGIAKSQELFLQLLGEAWRTPTVVDARNLSFLALMIGIIAAVITGLFFLRSPRNSQYYMMFITITAYLGIGGLLAWLTWTQIQTAYAAAREAGEPLDIWSQIILISGGFILLWMSWLAWRSATKHTSVTSTILRLLAGVILAIGAWVLIGELPRVIAAGDERWWEALLITVYYSIGTVPIQLVISLVLAVLLFQKIRGKGVFRLIYFLPYITPTVAAAAVFRVFFSGRPTAPINSVIASLGGKTLLWLDELAGYFR